MKRLSITADGRDVLDRIASARIAGLESFIATLPPEHRDGLSAALEPIVKDLG